MPVETRLLTPAPTAALAKDLSTSLPVKGLLLAAATMPLTARLAPNSRTNSWPNSSATFFASTFQYGW